MKKLGLMILVILTILTESCVDQYQKCTGGNLGYGGKVHKIEGPKRQTY